MTTIDYYGTKIGSETKFRTDGENNVPIVNEACFNSNPTSWSDKLDNFPKYARRQAMTRFLALYELYKKVLPIKGSIIECGVNAGFGVMTYSKLSAILEPTNFMRRIFGFDTFSGFPNIHNKDKTPSSNSQKEGDLCSNSYEELKELISAYDASRCIGHIKKTFLIKGDACETIPNFVKEQAHLVVSLLFLDFDLYEPTMAALEHFVPLMPRGAIIAFDELDNPKWPGESKAMHEYFKDNKISLKRFDFDPYISYAEVS
jgi:hypothetical protein